MKNSNVFESVYDIDVFLGPCISR